MTCPHCGYKDRYLDDDSKWVKGDKGEFYTLAIEFTRGDRYNGDRIDCYACPECNKTFIQEEDSW